MKHLEDSERLVGWLKHGGAIDPRIAAQMDVGQNGRPSKPQMLV